MNTQERMEEMYDQTKMAAEIATAKLAVEKSAEIVKMLETQGGKYLVQYLNDLYETEAKVDPSLFTKYTENGQISVSEATLGMHFGIATMIHTLRTFFDEHREIVHKAAQEVNKNSETSTEGV